MHVTWPPYLIYRTSSPEVRTLGYLTNIGIQYFVLMSIISVAVTYWVNWLIIKMFQQHVENDIQMRYYKQLKREYFLSATSIFIIFVCYSSEIAYIDLGGGGTDPYINFVFEVINSSAIPIRFYYESMFQRMVIKLKNEKSKTLTSITTKSGVQPGVVENLIQSENILKTQGVP